MSDVYKGLTIKLAADGSALSAALSDAKRQAKGTGAELRNLQRALKLDPGNAKLLAEQQKSLQKQLQASTDKLKLLKQAESEIGEANMSGEQWTHLQADIVLTEQRIAQLNSKIQETKAALADAPERNVFSRAGEAIEARSEQFEAAGKRISSVGSALTRTLTPAIVGAGGASVAAAVKIDTALTGVRKTVNGTEGQYRALKASAVEFSKVNAVSADQVLDIQALGAQLGFAIDELDGFARVASGLDIATDMDAETAATNMAQFANITGMAHDQIENYASSIVELGNNMATTEGRISDMSMRTAAAGKQIGLSQPQILGWSAAMASLGIEAEAGGTAFSNFVSSIDASVSSGGESLEAFAKVAGMSSDQFAASWRQSSSDTLQALLKGLSGADNMTLALQGMGVEGVRQSDVLKRLAGNTDLVSKALGHANDGWREGKALSAEVANRNDSLAAKLEMLKNRLVAMADEFGAPLADALLDVVEQAAPLIKQIEAGARAFSEMSGDEQRAVLQTLALAAALGPTLKVVGDGVGKVGKFGAAVKTFGNVVSGAEKATLGFKAGLAGLGVAAVVAVLAVAYSEWQNYNRAVKEAAEITEGLSNAEGAAASALSETAGSADDVAPRMGAAREAVDDLRSSMLDMARGWKDAWTDLLGTKTELDSYVATLGELQGQSSLTEVEQNRLKQAVEGYNKITGDSISITDAANGKLADSEGNAIKSTDAIKKNADAWYENARAQAYQSQVSDLMKEQVKAQDAMTKAQQEYNAAYDSYWKTAPGDRTVAQENTLRSSKKALDEAKGSYDGITGSIKTYSAMASVASQNTLAVINANSDLSAKLADAELSAASLSNGLSAMGVSAEQAGKLSTEQMVGLANQIKEMDALKIDPKTFTVGDDGTIADALGRVWDLDAKTIDGKHFTVNDDGTISVEGTDIDHLDAKQVAEKPFAVTDNGTAGKAAAKVADVHARKIGNKQFAISVLDRATSAIEGIRSRLASLSGASVNIGAHAAGGVSPSKISMIPMHADGGIVTRATMTSAGIVGEDGAEALLHGPSGSAIVPLTNRTYVRPFARAVADEMPQAAPVDTSGIERRLDAISEQIGSAEVLIDGKAAGRIIAPIVDERLGAEKEAMAR